ncbi:MAG: hypothetical protein ACI8XB_000466 [Patiriisocius sp.]|jgi:hypothetical protein
MQDEIINRVANSGLLTVDLADLYDGYDPVELDFRALLHEELILREKPFREFIKSNDWSKYADKWVCIYSSVDAIIPSWAFMLLSAAMTDFTDNIIQGSPDELRKAYILDKINHLDLSIYKDERVIIKGCGEIPIPDAAYVAITKRLKSVVKSLMYGEACSAVPVYKKKIKS